METRGKIVYLYYIFIKTACSTYKNTYIFIKEHKVFSTNKPILNIFIVVISGSEDIFDFFTFSFLRFIQ